MIIKMLKRCSLIFSQMKCTNIKDFTSCLCDLWMMICLYLLSKEIIICHILLWLSAVSKLFYPFHGVLSKDTLLLQPVKKGSQISDIVIDRRHADRLTIIPPPHRIVFPHALIIAANRIFPSHLQVIDVSADNRFCHQSNIVDFHCVPAPLFKQAQGLLITRHRLFAELLAAAVKAWQLSLRYSKQR